MNNEETRAVAEALAGQLVIAVCQAIHDTTFADHPPRWVQSVADGVVHREEARKIKLEEDAQRYWAYLSELANPKTGTATVMPYPNTPIVSYDTSRADP